MPPELLRCWGHKYNKVKLYIPMQMNAAGRLTVNRAVDGSCNCPSTPLTFRVTATDGGGLTKTIPVTVLVGKSDFTIYLADREW